MVIATQEPDPRKIEANAFKTEQTDRGLGARLNLACIFPFEDFFITEIQRGTMPDKIIGAMIVHFGALIGISAMNVTQGAKPSDTMLAIASISNEIQMKALNTALKQIGVKPRSVETPANDDAKGK